MRCGEACLVVWQLVNHKGSPPIFPLEVPGHRGSRIHLYNKYSYRTSIAILLCSQGQDGYHLSEVRSKLASDLDLSKFSSTKHSQSRRFKFRLVYRLTLLFSSRKLTAFQLQVLHRNLRAHRRFWVESVPLFKSHRWLRLPFSSRFQDIQLLATKLQVKKTRIFWCQSQYPKA